MFTLLVCLVVVVVSGAAVIRVTMGGAVKPATQPSTGQGQGRSSRDEELPADAPTHGEVAGDDPAVADETLADETVRSEAVGRESVDNETLGDDGEGDDSGDPAAAATASAASTASAGIRAAEATPRPTSGQVATDTLDRPQSQTRPPSPLLHGREAGIRRPRLEPQRGWRRLRSIVLLAVVLAMIGALLALMVGLAVAVFSLGLRDAVTS